jgi:hypothetical protein
MSFLLGCEESQTCTIAFRKKGFDAFSCDKLPCSGGHPEWHLQSDIFEILKQKWGLVISFPPCTDLAVSGAKHFEIKRKDGRQKKAIEFFFEIWKLSDVVENPIGILNGRGYVKKWFPVLYEEMVQTGFPFKPSQIIQPWQFGDSAQKSTCLWIKNLPLLTPTNIVDKGEFYISPTGKRISKWYSDNTSSKNRSKTFPGIAEAMADQWGIF